MLYTGVRLRSGDNILGENIICNRLGVEDPLKPEGLDMKLLSLIFQPLFNQISLRSRSLLQRPDQESSI